MLDRLKQFASNDRAQATDLPGVLLALVIAGVIGYIGIFVMSEVSSETALSSGDPLYNASENMDSAIDSAFSLVGIAFIVLILSVVIVYLYAVRGR